MAGWPTLPDVRRLLRMAPDDTEDLVIDSARLAAIDYGIGRTNNKWPADADPVPDGVREAAMLDAARIYRRRDSLDGTIAWGDAGVVRVGRADPDVERLYSAAGPVVFGELVAVLVAQAVADVLKAAQDPGDNVTVFAAPPETLNVPSVVVGRPIDVRYSVAGFALDEATVAVICVGPFGFDEVVDELVSFVRGAISADPTLGGAVPSCVATGERNWRPLRVGGAEFMAADVLLSVQT